MNTQAGTSSHATQNNSAIRASYEGDIKNIPVTWASYSILIF